MGLHAPRSGGDAGAGSSTRSSPLSQPGAAAALSAQLPPAPPSPLHRWLQQALHYRQLVVYTQASLPGRVLRQRQLQHAPPPRDRLRAHRLQRPGWALQQLEQQQAAAGDGPLPPRRSSAAGRSARLRAELRRRLLMAVPRHQAGSQRGRAVGWAGWRLPAGMLRGGGREGCAPAWGGLDATSVGGHTASGCHGSGGGGGGEGEGLLGVHHQSTTPGWAAGHTLSPTQVRDPGCLPLPVT
jgi:hypothetical protein